MRPDRPRVLAFDTAVARCAAALLSGTEIVAARAEPMDRGQAERLMLMLGEMLEEAGLAWTDLDALAVCTGPGNFTGLRIGIAAARGLALGLGVPAIGVTTFEALAEGRSGTVLVRLDDRRGGRVAQAFRDGHPLGEPGPAATVEARHWPAEALCLGADAAASAARLGIAAGPATTAPDPAAFARIAARRLSTPQPRPAPLYLRPADAAASSDPVPLLIDDA